MAQGLCVCGLLVEDASSEYDSITNLDMKRKYISHMSYYILIIHERSPREISEDTSVLVDLWTSWKKGRLKKN